MIDHDMTAFDSSERAEFLKWLEGGNMPKNPALRAS
jgi:hypothetical protein